MSSVEKQELIQGPVLPWSPSGEETALTERLLASDNELDKAYGEAYSERCFVREFGGETGEDGIAAVGEMDKLAEIEFRLGKEVDPQKLGLGDLVELAYPGTGKTRAERVRDGLRHVLEARKKYQDPNYDIMAPDLFGSFTEGGFRIEAYMPANARQARQWTIKVYREGEEEPFREETLPMDYEPKFGVDVSDKAALEQATDRILKGLVIN